tara:strand:- start:5098 stop:6018 length:921 start_codon:yes stop_codon:yes gene_type:complete
MKILVMGGTRFVGKSLVEKLILQNHNVDIFTRGNKPNAIGTNLIKGDRNDIEGISKLKNNRYEFIFDISGRELYQTKILIENIKNDFERYVYVSSAGVYKDCQELPLNEEDAIDKKSRHIGKYETEKWLIDNKIPFTSFRPTYIYGPGNYNKIENWFFERIVRSKEIPIPLDGSLITQLGHVSDLTDVMIKCLNNNKTKNNIYNCSGERGVTIKGLVQLCSDICNVDRNNLKLNSFDHRKLDPKSRKIFPIRLTHYQTSISKVKRDLEWQPKYNLLNGLKNSFENDFKFKLNDTFDFNSDENLFNS